MAPHDARERRHFRHDGSREVGAAQPGGGGRRVTHCGREAQALRYAWRQRLDALRLGEHGPEASVEDGRIERRQPILEAPLDVGVVKEGSIFKARAQDGLVARANDVGIHGAVGDGHEGIE